jgi:WD40 repeat protein
MIEPAKCGIQSVELRYFLLKSTKMWFTQWLSIIPMGNLQIHIYIFYKHLLTSLNQYRDKIVTGSFDRTAKIWDANTGQRYHTLKGHKMEIVCLSFDPHGLLVATGSMDHTAKLWDVETG